MDLSAVIFVAVAVAWAVYLVPKALRQHDEATRARSVDRFSHTMRVLARREAVSSRDARLVVTAGARRTAVAAEPGTEVEVAVETAPAPTGAEVRARRLAARRATGRRRRVLIALLAANAVVAAIALLSVVSWGWQAVPAGLLVGWLGLCRVMVRGERAAWDAMTETAPVAGQGGGSARADDAEDEDEVPEDYSVEANEQGFDEVTPAADTSALGVTPGTPQAGAPALWDPVPVTLPTYVGKSAAVRRSVRTIDLDATGVWTSGRSDEDAILAQQAVQRAVATSGEDDHRAVGS